MGGVNRIVRAVLASLGWDRQPPPLDYMLFYRAEVRVAAADGSTVDVQPEDGRIPSHQGVPIRVGIPGAVATVMPGAIVLLGWEKGDPSRIYAVPAWESGAKVTKLVFTDAANDSIEVSNGIVTVKVSGTQVLQASATSLKLGLVGALPFLYQGSVDSMGVPVTNNPAASASIVKGG
jgi:hypothetical protein